MPSYQSPVSSAAVEHSSFVSGSRPTAPIKTAIIRPTNFYDGVTKSSFGSSPDNKLKQYSKSDHFISHSSPVACASDIMSPLTPEADSDPLSDNCAVMYGTNATRRRKSKVEAWIESSSSAQSEESLSENRGLLRPLRRRQGMQLSSTSSTLSKEEVDLSFENLCQELLALSASCSTLERMISKTQGEMNSSHSDTSVTADKTEQRVANVKQQSADAKNFKRSVSDNSGSSLNNTLTAEGYSSKMDGSQNKGRWQKRRELIQNGRQERATLNTDNTRKIGNDQSRTSHHCQTDLRLQNGFPSAHHDQNGESLNINSSSGTRTVILPAKKLTALTIDVGSAHSTRQAVMDMPIRDSLVTVTSPQSLLKSSNSEQRFSPQSYRSKANGGCIVRESKSVTSNMCTTYANGVSTSTKQFQRDAAAGPRNTSTAILRSKSFNHNVKGAAPQMQRVPTADSEGFATDHVAAAITTQCVSSTPPKKRRPPPSASFNRSLSEPASFVTLTPDKRSSLIRSPSKKDLKNRQLLKVGMDFIRRNGEGETTHSYTSKDNLLMNNLDICNHSKSSIAKPDKMTLPITGYGFASKDLTKSPYPQSRVVKPSVGSDSVFEESDADDTRLLLGTPLAPVLSSTCKSRQLPTALEEPALSINKTTGSQKGNKTVNESLSSSFESEALDILASLKSANALKAQLRHGKFPTDVDPITGSPRQPIRLASDERIRLTSSHQHSYPSSNKSSCLSSPSGSTPTVLQHQFVVNRSPQFQPQTPSSRRSRQSYYDNVLQSPFGGMRISVASGSSSGTVFSRPWGDLPRWDDLHNDDFRHRVGSAVSSQCRSAENGAGGILSSPHRQPQQHHGQHNIFRFFDKEGSRSPSYIRSVSEEREQQHPNASSSAPRFPVSGIPDVALDADMSTPQHQRQRTHWELALDRTLNRVRTFTKMMQAADAGSCEITKYIHTLLKDNHSLPGILVGRFHTCTWETHSLDRKDHTKIHQNVNTPSRNCAHRDHALKPDWYSSNIQSSWGCERNAKSMPLSDKLAYANSGYLLSTTSSRDGSRSGEVISSAGAKEHIVLSNVRQFVDGMKRYLLNRPDTQMMFAIQRERIKMGADQFINLDAIMEAALEKVILQPLSDHLLNVITTHPDYSIREITQIESGMKIILNNRNELLSNILPTLTEIDVYDQTLRSVFQSMKSEFSPISKLQYLLQMALLFILVQNRSTSAPQEQDLLLIFVYAVARYGDATLIVHLAYIRHLIPSSIKSGVTAYVLSLYENTVQIYNRIAKVPSTLVRRTMILNEIVEKLSCHLMIADESTNHVIRKKLSLSRWSTVSELIDILHVDLANHELGDFRLYIVTDEKEVLLRPNDNVRELLVMHAPQDTVYSLVYRSTNTQMLLPPA